MNKDETEVVEK